MRHAGLLWCVWWESVMAGIKETEPDVAAQLLPPPEEEAADGAQPADRITPWRGFLRSGPVRHTFVPLYIFGNVRLAPVMP